MMGIELGLATCKANNALYLSGPQPKSGPSEGAEAVNPLLPPSTFYHPHASSEGDAAIPPHLGLDFQPPRNMPSHCCPVPAHPLSPHLRVCLRPSEAAGSWRGNNCPITRPCVLVTRISGQQTPCSPAGLPHALATGLWCYRGL